VGKQRFWGRNLQEYPNFRVISLELATCREHWPIDNLKSMMNQIMRSRAQKAKFCNSKLCSYKISGKSFDSLPSICVGVLRMLYKIDNLVPIYILVLHRIKADAMHFYIENGHWKFSKFRIFIPDGIQITGNYQISPFPKNEDCWNS
jgi:hypothetical protein